MPRQRCWVPKLRKVATKLPRRDQEACLKGAKAVYLSSTRREARAQFEEWAYQGRLRQPKAVKCLETDLEELVSFRGCPPAHWSAQGGYHQRQ